MAKVLGVGGAFFRARDPETLGNAVKPSASAGRALWTAVALLVGIGLVISAGRALSVFESGAAADGETAELPRLDRWSTGVMSSMLGAEPGTDAYREIELQNRELLAKFGENPGTTLLHVLPALAFLVLLPLQFSNRLRSRHPLWHRWSGRVILLLAVPIGISGLFFGLRMPYSGAVEASAIAGFGGLFFLSLVCGFLAVRRRDIVRHREWMIRMGAVALGVSTVRLVGLALVVLTRSGPEVWFGWSIWIGFGITVVVAEAWIRHARKGPGGELGSVVSTASPS